MPGQTYPLIDSLLQATFRISAREAHQVAVQVDRYYPMFEGEDGMWTVTTTPLVPGSFTVRSLFHMEPESLRPA